MTCILKVGNLFVIGYELEEKGKKSEELYIKYRRIYVLNMFYLFMSIIKSVDILLSMIFINS